MEDHKENTAMPEEEADGKRENETVEGAAGADETGRETEGKTGEEESKAENAAEKDPEQGTGQDPVEEESGAEEAEESGEPEGAAAEAEAAEEQDAAEKKEKGGFFRSKKELQKKEQEIADLKDQLLRGRAEFDNYRKRTDKEKSVRFDDGAMFILQKLLPVADNFERGLAQVPDEAKDDPYVAGMEKIYKQLMAMLEESGVTPIEAVGKPFDPEKHNAVMHIEDESLGDNTVAEEFQKGYCYKDRVLRHSMVKVAN